MKILIIDDSDVTIMYLKQFVMNITGHDYTFCEATNYDSARLFLNEYFDLVLCDNKLGNDKFGLDLVGDYSALWPDALCFLYSAESAIVNQTIAKKIKCHSISELKMELILALENFNKIPRYAEAEMQATMTAPTISPRDCDLKHAYVDLKIGNVEKGLEEQKDYSKELLKEFKGFRVDQSKDARNIMLLVFTCLIGFIANLILKTL